MELDLTIGDTQDFEEWIRYYCFSINEPEITFNAMCQINEEADFRNPNIPKVVTQKDGRLLYMSRAPIPTNKKLEFKKAMKQVCIYAFPKSTLKKFAAQTTKTPIESIEDIEILRFLEIGVPVKMVEVSRSSISVDYPEDVKRVENALNSNS